MSKAEQVHDTCFFERVLCDTVIRTAPDSAALQALFECDSLGNVLISELSALQGNRVKVAPQVRVLKVVDKTGRVRRDLFIDVLCHADSLEQHVVYLREQLTAAQSTINQTKQEKQGMSDILKFGMLICLIVGFVVGLKVGVRC